MNFVRAVYVCCVRTQASVRVRPCVRLRACVHMLEWAYTCMEVPQFVYCILSQVYEVFSALPKALSQFMLFHIVPVLCLGLSGVLFFFFFFNCFCNFILSPSLALLMELTALYSFCCQYNIAFTEFSHHIKM